MGGQTSKQTDMSLDCDPDENIHQGENVFNCENKGCNDKICESCQVLFKKKKVCADCKEVLDMVCKG